MGRSLSVCLVIWSRDGTTDGTCAGGPGAWGEARRGPDLEWNQNGRGCRLNLRTGRVRSLPSLTPSRAEPRRCVPRGGSEHAFVLGDDCDRRGVGWVVARRVRESGGEAYRLLIHYRRRRR